MSNDTCYLVIKFKGDEINWIHPISLNGRVIEAMYVDGVQVEPIRECEYVGDEISGWCSECRGWLDPACAYCPNCGARVKEGGDD